MPLGTAALEAACRRLAAWEAAPRVDRGGAAEQAQVLRDLGCTRLQGYLFGRPAPAPAVPAAPVALPPGLLPAAGVPGPRPGGGVRSPG